MSADGEDRRARGIHPLPIGVGGGRRDHADLGGCHAHRPPSGDQSGRAAGQYPLFLVADGMGGHIGGEIASASTIDRLGARRHSRRRDAQGDREGALAGVKDIASHPETTDDGTGTTLTGVFLDVSDEPPQWVTLNIGDSRVYLLRDDAIEQITTDHSVVQELIAAGRLSPEEAENHPYGNVITRAVGPSDSVTPDYVRLDVVDGDRFVICSDGLTKELTDYGIQHFLAENADPADAVNAMMDAALENGGRDNITIIVLDVASPPQPDPTPDRQPPRREARGGHGSRLTERVLWPIAFFHDSDIDRAARPHRRRRRAARTAAPWDPPSRPAVPVLASIVPARRSCSAVAGHRLGARAVAGRPRTAHRRCHDARWRTAGPGVTEARRREGTRGARAHRGRSRRAPDAERARRWSRHPDVTAFVARDADIWRAVPGAATCSSSEPASRPSAVRVVGAVTIRSPAPARPRRAARRRTRGRADFRGDRSRRQPRGGGGRACARSCSSCA